MAEDEEQLQAEVDGEDGEAGSAAETEQQLGDSACVEIEPQGDQGHALPPNSVEQPGHLLLMQKELAMPRGLVPAEPCRTRILFDMRIDQVELAAFVRGIGLGDVGLAGAQGLHLRPRENDAGLDRVLDLVVVAGPSILGDELPALALRRHDKTLPDF